MMQHLHWLPRCLTLWALATLIVFVVMLSSRSDQPVVFGLYSPLVAVTLLALLVCFVGALSARFILQSNPRLLDRLDLGLSTWRQHHWFMPMVLIVCSGSIASIWMFLLGNHLPTYGVLRSFLCLSVLLVGLALLYGGTVGNSAGNWRLPVIGGLLLLIGLTFLVVGSRPAMLKTDEAFIASMGLNVMQSGHTQPLIYRHALPDPDYFYGGLWSRLLGFWFGFVGFSFNTGRIYFWLLGLLSLPFLWFAIYRFYGEKMAWFSVLLSSFALGSQNYIRPDVSSAVFLSLALFAYGLAQKHVGWHFLVGLAVGLCIDSSPISFCFGIGFLLFYLGHFLHYIRTTRRWFWPPIWLLGAGGMVALAYYVLSRSGMSTFGTMDPNGQAFVYFSTITQRLRQGVFLDMIRQVFTSFFTGQPIIGSLAAIGVIVALKQRKGIDLLLVTVFATWMTVIILTYYYFPPFYITQGMPIVAALAARGMVGLGDAIQIKLSEHGEAARAAAVLLAIWILSSFPLDLWIKPASLQDIVETARQIAKVVPNNAVIVAAEPYYFGLLSHPNFVGGAIEGMLTTWQHLSPQQAWEKVAPDAFVFSAGWSTEPAHTQAVNRYLAQYHFALAGCWQTHSFGRVELWMRNASSPLPSDTTCIRLGDPNNGPAQ